MATVRRLLSGLVVAVALGTIVAGQDYYRSGGGTIANPILAPDGTALLPAYSFASEPTLGFWRAASGNVTLQGGTFTASSTISTQAGYGSGGWFTITPGATQGIALGSGATIGWDSATSHGGFNQTGIDTKLGRAGPGEIAFTPVLFAALGTPANGALAYCSDCLIAATCAGAGTGAFAKRLNGAWVCN
jgi:hypothetical protein